MMKTPWKPWHEVVKIRDDLRSGELPMHMFAADLYEVMMQRRKRPIYEDPEHFFALTFPTYNLRHLVQEVVLRLAGKNDKAVRQLALTYGGGKTHTLITLRHLVNDPDNLPNLPAVAEFVQEIGQNPPQCRIAGLCFDKLDVEKGMEVRSPNGKIRTLKQPWSVLAYQLAGDAGLKLLHADGKTEERETAPAENLLSELLAMPIKDGLGVLILLDEVLMFAREKVAHDKKWLDRLRNFFQYLSQAATKSDRCCVVVSLLASDPKMTDTFGRGVDAALQDVFQRQREEVVEPVVKEDVAEVLRRRFFTPESLRRPRGVPSACRGGAEGYRSRGRADGETGRGSRGTVPQELPVPSRSDGGALLEVDAARAFSADTRCLADFRLGVARGGEVGHQPAGGACGIPDRAGQGRSLRIPAGDGGGGRYRGVGRQEAGVDRYPGQRVLAGAKDSDRVGRAEKPRSGAGGRGDLSAFPAGRPECPDAGSDGTPGLRSPRQD
ncbi:MAG: DUF499 domain-containing protein [Kiritimatiellae bacterium]|nr:DUF499 domain-containing protein [Kiritimatiellia bacterium]